MPDEKDNLEFDLSILEKEGKTEFSEKIKIHREKTVKAFQEFIDLNSM